MLDPGSKPRDGKARFLISISIVSKALGPVPLSLLSGIMSLVTCPVSYANKQVS